MQNHLSDSSHEHVLPYNPQWVDVYTTEASKIKTACGESLLGIEHIGSTSIPGLSAKPIIDMMILIDHHENAEQYISKLTQLGYTFDANALTDISTERHLLRKGNPTQFHLSIAYANRGGFWKRQLAFRDYLRNHPEDRDRYAVLKQKLIAQDPTGKDTYIAGKTDLVNEILDKSGFVRWKPPQT